MFYVHAYHGITKNSVLPLTTFRITTQRRCPPKKRTPVFKEAHLMAYGITVCERDASMKTVVSVSCKFCLYFGRDMKIGAKRKATARKYPILL